MTTPTSAPAVPTRDGRRRPTPLTATLLVLLLIGVAVPLGTVLVRAVTGYNGQPSALGDLADAANVRVLGNTLLLGLMVVVFATLMAAPLAFLMSWTRLREQRWIDIVLMVPFMTPPYVSSIAWLDFTRVHGLGDQWFGPFGGALRDAVNSAPGMAVIMAGEIFTFLYLLLRTTLDAIPASLDEMGSIAGASPWQRLRRILAPLMSSTMGLGALIVFIRAIGEFGAPVTIGQRIGFPVLVSEIYGSVVIAPLDFPRAAALSSVLLALGVLVWGLQQAATRRPLRLGVRASRRTTVRPGIGGVAAGWTWFAIVGAITVVVPYLAVVLGAMTILRSKPLSLDNLTFDYFGVVLQPGGGLAALEHSATVAVAAATLAAILGTVCALAISSRRRLSRGVDILSILPDTVPAIVFAIGLIFFWNSPWLPATPYNTPWILVIGYAVLFLPMVVQNVRTSRDSVDGRFAEAAAIAGAGAVSTFVRITLPLLAPGIIAGWLLAFLVGIREVVLSSLIRPSSYDLLSPWILGEFDQGHRPEAMAMTLIGVGSSTVVLVVVEVLRGRQARRRLA